MVKILLSDEAYEKLDSVRGKKSFSKIVIELINKKRKKIEKKTSENKKISL